MLSQSRSLYNKTLIILTPICKRVQYTYGPSNYYGGYAFDKNGNSFHFLIPDQSIDFKADYDINTTMNGMAMSSYSSNVTIKLSNLTDENSDGFVDKLMKSFSGDEKMSIHIDMKDGNETKTTLSNDAYEMKIFCGLASYDPFDLELALNIRAVALKPEPDQTLNVWLKSLKILDNYYVDAEFLSFKI